MMKLVQGVGINDKSIKGNCNGKPTKEYALWTSMLTRVFSTDSLSIRPTYKSCSVSDNFKQFHLFHAWCQLQIGFTKIGYQLDKDLLIKGNKLYSEDTCVFIPKELNMLLIKKESCRGQLPIGVTKHGSSYQVRCSINGKKVQVGTFNTPDLAFQAYKTFKEAHIRELAELYKGYIDPRAYNALINYTVELDD